MCLFSLENQSLSEARYYRLEIFQQLVQRQILWEKDERRLTPFRDLTTDSVRNKSTLLRIQRVSQDMEHTMYRKHTSSKGVLNYLTSARTLAPRIPPTPSELVKSILGYLAQLLNDIEEVLKRSDVDTDSMPTQMKLQMDLDCEDSELVQILTHCQRYWKSLNEWILYQTLHDVHWHSKLPSADNNLQEMASNTPTARTASSTISSPSDMFGQTLVSNISSAKPDSR
jgi:hypothetical protein